MTYTYERLGRRTTVVGASVQQKLPYLGFLFGAATYGSAIDDARAAHDSEAAARLEAIAVVLTGEPG